MAKKSDTEELKGKLELQLVEVTEKFNKADTSSKKLIDQSKQLIAEKQGLIELKTSLVHENNQLLKVKLQLQNALDKEQSEKDHWQKV